MSKKYESEIDIITFWLESINFTYYTEQIKYAVLGFCLENVRISDITIFYGECDLLQEIYTTGYLKGAIYYSKNSGFLNNSGEIIRIKHQCKIKTRKEFISKFINNKIIENADDLLDFILVRGFIKYVYSIL
jgi:hypothetical protein